MKKIKNFKFNIIENEGADDKKIIVVVIGESARRANFSLYGYNRNTNPFLEKEDNIIVMNNAEAVFNITEKSYSVFMSRTTYENMEIATYEPSLLKAFQEADFHTVYIK